MSSTPSKPGSSPSIRERRRQAVVTALARLVGAIALIVMAAAIFQVVAKRPSLPADSPSPLPTPATALSAGDEPAALPLLGQTQEASAPAPETESASDTAPPSPSGGIERIETKRHAIAHTLRQYFGASSVEEKIALIRDSTRVGPLLERHYKQHPLKQRGWKDLGWTLPIYEPGLRLAFAQATFLDTPPVSVIVEETPEGLFLVDWESSVHYSEFTWRDFLATRPLQPTLMRVLASRPPGSRDDSYAAIETGMAVLSLRHPTEAGSVYGSYNPHDPRLHALLSQLEEGQWLDVPVTLRLSFPPKAAEQNAVLITAVEGRGWLQVSQPRS